MYSELRSGTSVDSTLAVSQQKTVYCQRSFASVKCAVSKFEPYSNCFPVDSVLLQISRWAGTVAHANLKFEQSHVSVPVPGLLQQTTETDCDMTLLADAFLWFASKFGHCDGLFEPIAPYSLYQNWRCLSNDVSFVEQLLASIEAEFGNNEKEIILKRRIHQNENPQDEHALVKWGKKFDAHWSQ